MDKALNFQISLFGSFTNIQPDLGLTMRINSSLQDDGFVPATVQVNTFNPVEQKMLQETRLQMVSTDKMWTVVFLAERIDINYSFMGGDNGFTSLDGVAEKAKSICKKAFSPIAKTTGTRLAINGQFLLKEMDDTTKRTFISRFLIQPKVYEDKPLCEWNVRYNSLTNIYTSEKTLEQCNFIINLGDVIGIDSQTGCIKRGTSLGIDINTSPQNIENKYTIKDLLYFCDGALENMKKALYEIEGI